MAKGAPRGPSALAWPGPHCAGRVAGAPSRMREPMTDHARLIADVAIVARDGLNADPA
jgi:hypothetical protein